MHGLHLWDLLPPGQAKEARECESTLYFTFSAILGTLVDRDADYVGDKLYPMMENLIKLWLVRQANKLKSACKYIQSALMARTHHDSNDETTARSPRQVSLA